jgi:hypothetical protein
MATVTLAAGQLEPRDHPVTFFSLLARLGWKFGKHAWCIWVEIVVRTNRQVLGM